MPRLAKRALLRRIEGSLADAGWAVDVLSEPDVHPAELRISRGPVRVHLKAYVWNLSHGGKPRSPDELRIQVTGVSHFETGTSFQTVILGWSDKHDAFAAFDVDRHKEPLGSSPSLQISRHTLEAGVATGIAARKKSNSEVVVAFRPSLLGSYVEHRSQLHNPSDAQRAVDSVRSTLSSDATNREEELSFYAAQRSNVVLPGFSQADEQGRREEILSKLEELQKQIEEIRQQPSMMGHNRPPADAQIVEDPDELAEAARDIGGELQASRPNPEAVAQRATILERVAQAWRVAVAEAKKTAKLAGDKLRERAVEGLITAATGGGLAFHNQIGRAAAQVVDAVISWLHIFS